MATRRHLASTSGLTLVLAWGWGSAALAQSAPDTSRPSRGVEEVVVTARKRTERLQKVPVAVTALGQAQIAQNKVVNVTDLGALTPSLTFQQSSYSPFGSFVGIRGQKTGDTILSETPSIGIYVDDVYQPSTVGTGIGNLEDTRQIEVLKGPQGTLYGRNTTGGALKITSNLPDYSGFYGRVKVGFGNYGSNEDALMLNVPIVPDKVALRVDAQRNYHDGFATDRTNNRAVDDIDSKSVRATLRLNPTDSLEVLVRGNWTDGRSGGTITNLEAIKPVFGAGGVPTFSPALLNVGLGIGAISFGDLLPFLVPALGPPTPAQFGAVIAGQEKAYQALLPYLKQGYNVNYSTPEYARVKNDGASVNATYRILDDLSIKSVTSYQYAAQAGSSEVDGTPFKILEGPGDVTSLDQLTQELQLNGTGLDGKLNYTGGFFYYYLTGNDDSPGELELPYLNGTGSPVNTRDHLTDKSYAFYGQATYAFTPSVHLTGGVRWTQEDTALRAASTDGPANTCNVPPPAGIAGAPCVDNFTSSFHNFSYTTSLDWQATSDILLYASTSRGFKAGGQNQRGSVVGGFDNFAPEQVTDYEIGLKSDLLSHRVRINLAAYHSDYTNIQRTVLEQTPTGQTITEVKNAAAATIDGVEAEVIARPIPPLTLSANGAYTSPKYSSYEVNGADFAGHVFQDQPLWQFNVGATYVQDIRMGALPATLTGTVNFAYQSSVNFAPDNISIYSNNYPIQGGYGLLNARVALDVPKYGVTLEWWGKNLTDRKYLTGTTDVTAALGVGVGYLSDPMTFGFDLIKRF